MNRLQKNNHIASRAAQRKKYRTPSTGSRAKANHARVPRFSHPRSMLCTGSTVSAFRAMVRRFYARNKRDFPWRRTRNAYHIYISEIMLQQTQADRVAHTYPVFIRAFPTVATLARAPLSKILLQWQGLGYNRRALLLKKAAARIEAQHAGKIPCDYAALRALPGVGPYTAAAIRAFAYNEPALVLDTNIRSVYLHYFFSERRLVSDRALLPLIERTMDKKNPRKWFGSLMDLGALIKKECSNPGRRSAHYAKQGTFANSNRFVRGRVVAHLLAHRLCTLSCLCHIVGIAQKRATPIIAQLKKEGLILREGAALKIAK